MVPMVNATGKHRAKKRHHGDGTVVKLTDAWRREPWVWKLRRTVDGKRVTVASCSGTSRAAVEAEAKRILARLDAPRTGMTVAELLDRWLDAKRGVIKPSSWDRHRSTVATVRARFADLVLDDARPDHVRERLAGTANQKNRTILVVRSACRYAADNGWIDHDPTAGIADFIHEPRVAPTIDWDQAVAILGLCRESQWGAMVALAMLTGLRRGELLALRWQDVRNDVISVEHQLRRVPPAFRVPGGPTVEAVAPKSKKSVRKVPVTDAVADVLAEQKARQAKAIAAVPVWAANDLVFANDVGETVWPNNATTNTEAIVRQLVPGMRLHDLRHAWETLLSSAGASDTIRMGLAGHRTAAQTREYTHVIPADARQASEAMHRRLGR